MLWVKSRVDVREKTSAWGNCNRDARHFPSGKFHAMLVHSLHCGSSPQSTCPLLLASIPSLFTLDSTSMSLGFLRSPFVASPDRIGSRKGRSSSLIAGSDERESHLASRVEPLELWRLRGRMRAVLDSHLPLSEVKTGRVWRRVLLVAAVKCSLETRGPRLEHELLGLRAAVTKVFWAEASSAAGSDFTVILIDEVRNAEC